ncbi:hypothetical protein CBR64_05675 [Cellulosimicrobium cellulans]|uniref:YdbS-like PH domain-containing protein n=1 Tax=Cellulosimicrobium cellulans TaxID=1710 RepID=A0A1Y0HSB4_CELCE|nr:PH domain-containing protein [Cellulosimicrobium cellulans]ARU51052.1 hypothetical protein CBR64_05675 [Cellulosimicrobium cellulans]
MGLSEKHLTEGEHVVMELKEHAKALFWPFVLLLVLVAAVVVTVVLVPNDVVRWVVAGLALVAAVVWVFVPWLRWRTTEYTVTNKRIAMRSGIITRTGRDIPLYRINDVNYEKGPIDRIFGCGTLVISDATDKPGLNLHDVPDVENVQVRLHDLLFTADDGSDDGEWPPNEPPRGPRAPASRARSADSTARRLPGGWSSAGRTAAARGQRPPSAETETIELTDGALARETPPLVAQAPYATLT